jgi:glycosyltransferase involved in cell wall biosynthesis
MSYDYYDPMATPEWEETDESGWAYRRPPWFVQGPFRLCAPYLEALIDGNTRRRKLYALRIWAYRHALRHGRLMRAGVGTKRLAAVTLAYAWPLTRLAGRKSLRAVGFTIAEPALSGEAPPNPLAGELARRFAEDFPDRSDTLLAEDVEPWLTAPGWQELFARYDVVQCYATDPIRALVAEKRPYVAFEHGTLRDFTLGDDPLHRLNALAYREADRVFVTNGDCLAFAQRLKIPDFRPMIHPVDVAQHERVDAQAVRHIRAELKADVVLFSPLRHDWAIKGTQLHIEALPELLASLDAGVVLVLCEWGAEVDRSRELAAQLGVADSIVWRPPLDRRRLIAHMHAADVVLDQMTLPHFGATAPQALAAGTPVIMSYEPASTAWIVGEPAPILSAFTPSEIAAAVRTALDPEWRREFKTRAHDWIYRYHHPDRIVLEHCRAYQEVLEGDK